MGRICFGGFRISNRRIGSGHYFGGVAAPRVARDYDSMLALLAGWRYWQAGICGRVSLGDSVCHSIVTHLASSLSLANELA
ncbi:hypothetical protein N9B88_03590 [Rubripirellula sp.]|nr:hypothetical protein [Rubripirellula sp.]